ncbi:hypothetical protein ILUMI_07258 [Ignelater luminosus]|uniref:Uncharacterized protein n=1 Tax=Ignelater luminosus TaxID=2038154 RepID=A0A8K0GBS5_IGNLU|nr:hypothetical protein ILUMI_07258 [Ignelater luminosus]
MAKEESIIEWRQLLMDRGRGILRSADYSTIKPSSKQASVELCFKYEKQFYTKRNTSNAKERYSNAEELSTLEMKLLTVALRMPGSQCSRVPVAVLRAHRKCSILSDLRQSAIPNATDTCPSTMNEHNARRVVWFYKTNEGNRKATVNHFLAEGVMGRMSYSIISRFEKTGRTDYAYLAGHPTSIATKATVKKIKKNFWLILHQFAKSLKN